MSANSAVLGAAPQPSSSATGNEAGRGLIPAPIASGWRQLRASGLASRSALPALVVAGAILAGLLWVVFGPPERTALFRSLPDADKAAVVQALEAGGFDVRVDPRSGAVLLPPADHARARMVLAADGLPRAAPGGLDMLADMPLGTSRAVEGVKLRMAQERELARSIESIDGVEQARVIIATPDASPFVRERPQPSASVSVTLARGRTLSDQQTRAIAHLVAGAVAGLQPDRVAIADQTGRLLAGEPGSMGDLAADRRLQLQLRLEARAREAILALLTPIVGPDRVTAQVAVDLDLAVRDATSERFDPQSHVVRSEAVSRSTSAEPRAIGIPGALTNAVPNAAAVQAEAPAELGPPEQQQASSESQTRNYEIGRSVEVVSQAPGAVRRLTASVLIDEAGLAAGPGRAEQIAEIARLVESAIGADAARGDRVTVVARPFVADEPEATPVWQQPVVVEGAKWLAVALVALGILFFVVRPVLARLPRAQGPRVVSEPLVGEAGGTPTAGGVVVHPRPEPRLIDYSAKLTEARLIASTDAARATAVARRLLAEEAA